MDNREDRPNNHAHHQTTPTKNQNPSTTNHPRCIKAEELRERTERSVTKGRAPARPKAAPIAKPKAAATPSATKPNPVPGGGYVDRPGVDSTADPATVLPDPIIPKF